MHRNGRAGDRKRPGGPCSSSAWLTQRFDSAEADSPQSRRRHHRRRQPIGSILQSHSTNARAVRALGDAYDHAETLSHTNYAASGLPSHSDRRNANATNDVHPAGGRKWWTFAARAAEQMLQHRFYAARRTTVKRPQWRFAFRQSVFLLRVESRHRWKPELKGAQSA